LLALLLIPRLAMTEQWQASGTLTKTTVSAIAAKNADRGARYADMVAEIERVAERRMDTLNASARLSARRTCIEVALLLTLWPLWAC